MIYLIGGAPRSGKTVLGQQLAAKISASWISTDALHQLLRVKVNDGPPNQWDASPTAITDTAAWFFPCFGQFFWGTQT